MNHIRFCLPAALIILSSQLAFGQSYKTAAGIRVDNGVHLTVQQHLIDKWTAEGILHTSFGSNELGITLLAEEHRKILFRGINFYYGAGGHYYWQSGASREANTLRENVAGLSFIGGLEMSLGKLNFAIDWKPELHLAGDQAHPFEWNGAAVSVRYIIAKRERKQIKDWGIWDKFGGKKNNGKKRR